jgi:transcriptional regulator with XRE-family HTH domain
MVTERIKELMQQKGLNGRKLAELTGTTQPNMSALLSGKCSPNLNSLEKVASALEVELYELFAPSVPKPSVTAFVKTDKGVFYAESLSELKGIVRLLDEPSEPKAEVKQPKSSGKAGRKPKK